MTTPPESTGTPTSTPDLSPTVHRLVVRATLLGLRPHVRAPYRSTIQVTLNGEGIHAGFGVVYVGARSGRVIRSVLRHGNDARPLTYQGYHGALCMLRNYAMYLTYRGALPTALPRRLPPARDAVSLVIPDRLRSRPATADPAQGHPR